MHKLGDPINNLQIPRNQYDQPAASIKYNNSKSTSFDPQLLNSIVSQILSHSLNLFQQPLTNDYRQIQQKNQRFVQIFNCLQDSMQQIIKNITQLFINKITIWLGSVRQKIHENVIVNHLQDQRNSKLLNMLDCANFQRQIGVFLINSESKIIKGLDFLSDQTIQQSRNQKYSVNNSRICEIQIKQKQNQLYFKRRASSISTKSKTRSSSLSHQTSTSHFGPKFSMFPIKTLKKSKQNYVTASKTQHIYANTFNTKFNYQSKKMQNNFGTHNDLQNSSKNRNNAAKKHKLNDKSKFVNFYKKCSTAMTLDQNQLQSNANIVSSQQNNAFKLENKEQIKKNIDPTQEGQKINQITEHFNQLTINKQTIFDQKNKKQQQNTKNKKDKNEKDKENIQEQKVRQKTKKQQRTTIDYMIEDQSVNQETLFLEKNQKNLKVQKSIEEHIRNKKDSIISFQISSKKVKLPITQIILKAFLSSLKKDSQSAFVEINDKLKIFGPNSADILTTEQQNTSLKENFSKMKKLLTLNCPADKMEKISTYIQESIKCAYLVILDRQIMVQQDLQAEISSLLNLL